MRETKFIEQNRQKWAEYEQMLRENERDPDRLRELFVQITDDFSYARTFYPNRMVRVFLNGLAQTVFHSFQRHKKVSASRFWQFWKHDLPQIIHESRGAFRLSFGIFLLSMLVGIISSRMDVDFTSQILGDEYVNMTLENIKSGDPMKVYKQDGALGMSLGIAANNLFVALLTFLFGASWGLGSLFFLIQNGVMVGAFQWFFIEKGVGLESFLTIWIHGTLEISAIVIAGAAGLTMASGLLFPATLSRGQAFRRSASRGLKIFIGIAPVLLLAAFFEGFLTRHTELPNFLRAAFIAVSLVFILTYFVWLPWKKARRGDFSKPIFEADLRPTVVQPLDFEQLRSAGEIFSDSFFLLKKQAARLLPLTLGAAALACVFIFSISKEKTSQVFDFQSFAYGSWGGTEQFFQNSRAPFLFLFQAVVVTILAFVSLRFLKKETLLEPDKSPDGWFENLKNAVRLFPHILLILFFYNEFSDWNWRPILLPLFPILMLAAAVSFFEKRFAPIAILRSLTLIRADFWKSYLLGWLFTVIGFLCYLFVNSLLFQQIFDLVAWNFSLPSERMADGLAVFQTFLSLSILYLIFVLQSIGGGLLFHALREIQEATSLQKMVETVGSGRAIRGLARE